MTKFWGMGIWLDPDAYQRLTVYTFKQIYRWLQRSHQTDIESQSSLIYTFQRMMQILKLQSLSLLCKIELIYTLISVLGRMWHWSSKLTQEYLQPLCASPQFFKQ